MSERIRPGGFLKKAAVGVGGLSIFEAGAIMGLNPIVDLTVVAGTLVTGGGAAVLEQRRERAREIAMVEYLKSPQFVFDQLVGWANAFLTSGDSMCVAADSFTNQQRIPRFSHHVNRKTDVWAVEPGKTVETATPIQEYLQGLLDSGVIQRLPYYEAGYQTQKGKTITGKHIGVSAYIETDQPEKIIAMASTSTTKKGALGEVNPGEVTQHEAYSRSFFSSQHGVELIARTVTVDSSYRRLT